MVGLLFGWITAVSIDDYPHEPRSKNGSLLHAHCIGKEAR